MAEAHDEQTVPVPIMLVTGVVLVFIVSWVVAGILTGWFA